MSQRGARVAPAVISKLSGPLGWRQPRPRSRTNPHRGSGSDASKDTAGCACKNVTDWVDHHALHVKCCEASILFRPCITVISGSKHPTSLTHYGMRSGEDVIVATISGQCRNVSRCQTYVGKRPTVAVVSGAIHASSASCCSGKDSSDRNDRERPNVAAVQTIVNRRPAAAMSVDRKTPPTKSAPTKM